MGSTIEKKQIKKMLHLYDDQVSAHEKCSTFGSTLGYKSQLSVLATPFGCQKFNNFVSRKPQDHSNNFVSKDLLYSCKAMIRKLLPSF